MKRDFGEIAEFCKTHWPKESQTVLHFADAVCENRFLFDRPLDLERTREEVAFPGEIDWYYKLNGDREFLFQLNRHYFLISLGQAHYLTGDPKYLHHFVRLITDWIRRVPVDDPGGDNPWRSLEVGLRGEYWTKAMAYLEGTPFDTPELRERYCASLTEHADILRRTHGARYKMSNWGVIQDSGLFAISVALGYESDMQLAIERLTEQSELQLMADGVHWEQSATYHAEVFSCFLNVARIAGEHGITLPEKLLRNINRMADVNQMWVKPNHRQPLFGDSDDNDIRDLLSRAALVLGRPELKFSAYPVLDFESAWLFSAQERERYEKMEVVPPAYTDVMLADSGTYILRSGWAEDDDYLCMHNGYTAGGHAHADKLHFDLMLGGRDVLVDSGRYTYVPGKIRSAVKGARGHNTTLVGGREFMKIHGWGYLTHAPAIQYPVFQGGDCTLIGGAHLGYFKTFGTVFAERRILRIQTGLYLIFDTFRSRIRHRYEQYFHFSPDGRVALSGNTATYTDGAVTAKAHFFARGLTARKIPSEYSPCYNSKVPNDAVQTRFWGLGNTHAVTAIYGGQTDRFREFSVCPVKAVDADSGRSIHHAQGIVIQTPECEYTVCTAYEERTRPYVCNGITATGTVTVFRDGERIFTKW